MPSDDANSAWHPALMPNSAVDVVAHAPSNDSPAEPTTTGERDGGAQEAEIAQEADTTAQAQAHSHISVAQHDSSGADDWFPEYESGSPWLEQAPSAPAAPDDIKHDAAPSDEYMTEEEHSSSKAAKHASTISFARTVSHEVNWDGDDDDQEWTLPRTDTDPFKFMPPNDRTNSFPAVPTLVQPGEQDGDQPLPSSQAEDVLHEVEQEGVGSADPVAPPSAFPESHQDAYGGQGDLEGLQSPQQYAGGDLLDATAEDSDARYAEGLPLISHEDASDRAATEERVDAPDLFAQEADGDEDDFFNQVGGTDQPASYEGPTQHALERKSTMQVLGSAMPSMVDRTETGLEGTPEEDELLQGEPPPANSTPGVVDGEVEAAAAAANESNPAAGGDLAAKWAAVFGGDDDSEFLLDDSAADPNAIDAAAFLGDDDDGLLEDVPEPTSGAPPAQPLPSAAQQSPAPTVQQPPVSSRYMPTETTPALPRQASNPYFPSVAAPVVTQMAQAPSPYNAPAPSSSFGYGAPPPITRPEPNKAQSFADKAKGGYSSPYDLPMEVVKPRKRQSMQQLPRTAATPSAPPSVPPPRISSMQVPPLTQASFTNASPPGSSHSDQHATAAVKPPPLKQSKESFFEDLPASSKPRPASRQSQKSLPSPLQSSPHGPPQASPYGPPRLSPLGSQAQSFPGQPSPPQPQQPPTSEIPDLVAPQRVTPYAPLQSNTQQPGVLPPAAPANTKYSPAPGHLSSPAGVVPAPASNKYSPAPANNRAHSAGYTSAPSSMPPPVLPHQPRTSSPLAHFEVTRDRIKPGPAGHADGQLAERRSSSSMYEPRLNRVPSLPPTREVEEEDGPRQTGPVAAAPPAQPTYSPQRPRHTPPPPAAASAYSPAAPSPPKRSSVYAPSSQPAPPPHTQDFVPPQRSQTQSPGALNGVRTGINTADPVPRPSSVHDPTSPRSTVPPLGSFSGPTPAVASPVRTTRSRGFSQNLDLVPPTDGREHDPLQRWRGAPLFSWGVGGTIVTSFPKDVPRYGMNQAVPSVLRTPGEIKVKSIRELQPLEDRLAKFPGPLKGKSKKKETLAWLTTGIEGLELGLPNLPFRGLVSHEEKRSAERVLLWKILRILVEFDGVLDGSEAVNKAVRDVLNPGADEQATSGSALYAAGGNLGGTQEASCTQMQSDAVDSATVEQMRRSLLAGDREKAVWDAADKRLWGHALLIANTASPELYRKVAQEFVRKEVNYPGHNNESLAALYGVLSGNHDESVDELVPVHARAGLQLVATNASAAASTDSLAGLDKWRETLGLVLNNRSPEDIRAINSLGNLLSGYGRAEAAHICFLFARNASLFGGLDDAQANFVLVGADHRRQADQFAKETEALLLSEVFEYGLSLSNTAVTTPHLAAYKLQHAMTLAEYGYRDKALQYCEAISNAITSQTRRSPYHHPVLEACVEDLMKRLRLAPKGESNSWMTKPSMNKVSDSMWNRFNKFVAGDENDGSASGADGGGAESGPFARLPGGTPTISRPPSAAGTTGMEMFGPQIQPAPGYPVVNGPVAPAPATRAGSRYAPPASQSATAPNPYEPNAAYAPAARSSMERSSGEYSRSSYDLPRQSSELASAYSPKVMPNTTSTPSPSYPDSGQGMTSYVPSLPSGLATPPQSLPPSAGLHPSAPSNASVNGSPYAPIAPTQNGPTAAKHDRPVGYEAPSYGYGPTSMGTSFEAPSADTWQNPGFEPPSFQPHGYEPPSHNPQLEQSAEDGDEPRPKPRSFMDDDDDIPALGAQARDKTKGDKDRENAEMFRKAAEEDAKRAEAEKAAKAKKGWGLGGWWGAGKKETTLENAANKPIRAKLGEKSSFYFDPEIKRWVNKNASPEDVAVRSATPPPPRSAPRSAAGTPPPPTAAGSAPPGGSPGRAPPPAVGRLSAPPSALNPSPSVPNLAAVAAAAAAAQEGLGAPPMMRSASNTSASSLPPSRPATIMSNASSIDDLLGPAAPRKPGAKKARKGGRYVDVMAK